MQAAAKGTDVISQSADVLVGYSIRLVRPTLVEPTLVADPPGS